MFKKTMPLFLIIAMLFISCNKEQTLQEYYIEKQDSNNFMFIDVPSSIISLKDDAPEDVRQTLESVRKLNLMIFKINDRNKADYQKEKENLKNILKAKRYNDLMRLTHEGVKVSAKYTGDIDAIDEMILFASDDKKGFLVARLLGDHINPEMMIKLLKNINDVDDDNPVFSEIGELIKNAK